LRGQAVRDLPGRRDRAGFAVLLEALLPTQGAAPERIGWWFLNDEAPLWAGAGLKAATDASVLSIEDQIERRLKAIGYGVRERERLRACGPIVARVIGRIVEQDFERAFTIHPPLRETVGAVAATLYPLYTSHYGALFSGEFDEAYRESLKRLSELERVAQVGARPRVSIAMTLMAEISLAQRRSGLLRPRRLRDTLTIVERALTYDVNTAITLDREMEAAEVRRRKAAIDEAATRLRERIGAVERAIGGAAETFAATSVQTAEATRFVGSTISALAGASEQVRERSLQTAAATEEMSVNIAEIGQRAHQSLSIANRAVADAEEMSRSTSRLREVTESIGAFVGLIDSIAAQTNLLALNATIEAARAGEAGRGFSVVASEVKSLATQTAGATREIATQIAQLSASAEACGAHSAAIGATIGEMRLDSQAIAAAVSQQSAVTAAIARDAQEVATRSDEAIAGTRAVDASLARSTGMLERANAAASEIAMQVGAAEATVADALRTLREAS